MSTTQDASTITEMEIDQTLAAKDSDKAIVLLALFGTRHPRFQEIWDVAFAPVNQEGSCPATDHQTGLPPAPPSPATAE